MSKLLVQLFDGSSWVQDIQSSLIATQYEYLTFTAYACEEVPQRLRALLSDRGISKTAIDNCIYHYEIIAKETIKQAQNTVKQSEDLAIAFQRKIMDRVALVTQNDAVIQLAETGKISEFVATQICQQINVE